MQTISKPCKCTEQKQAQQLDALLSAGLSWVQLPHLKRNAKSNNFFNDKEKTGNFFHDQSWGQKHSPIRPWLEMHRCPRLGSPHYCPSGCLGMQAQHQRSTYAGNIPSSYGNPCKLDPCPSVCYLHVLTKAKGKGTWALPINLAKAFDNYLAKEGCLEDPFSKQILRNYQPCVSTPKTPEQHKECVNQQNTVNHNSCPILLSYNLWGTSHEQLWPWSCSVWKSCNGKKMHQLLYFGLGKGWYWRASSWATSETYSCYQMNNSWTVAGMLTGAVLPQLSDPYWLVGHGTWQGQKSHKAVVVIDT